MRHGYFLLLLALATGCARGASVAGSFDPDDDAAAQVRHVWAVGRDGQAPVQENRFTLGRLPAGSADLRFAGVDGELARLRLDGLPRGARVELRGVWIDRRSGLAFPAEVGLRGAGVVVVNGLRLAPPGRVRGPVREAATVLAVSDDAEALLVRPRDERLPDLRVVLTPATQTRTPDGDPARADRLAAGDSVRVEGRAAEGYVIASRLVVPGHLAHSSPPSPTGGATPAARAADASDDGTAPAAERRRGPPREPPGRGRGRRGRD